MAVPVVMPKQGNSVESCVIIGWNKKEGDPVSPGDVLCEAETDKAVIEVEAGAEGILLKTFFQVDDDVPVQTVIAVIGEAGEDVSGFDPGTAPADAAGAAEAGPSEETVSPPSPSTLAPSEPALSEPALSAPNPAPGASAGDAGPVSPRARNIAAAAGLDTAGLTGTGPGGRIIERDVKAALSDREPLTPAAVEQMISRGLSAPAQGTGLGGRVTTADLISSGSPAAAVNAGGAASVTAAAPLEFPGPLEEVAVKGVRKVVAARMKESLAVTAQLTNSASGDASALLAYRKKLKAGPDERGLKDISLNDMLLYLVSRVLLNHPVLNAHWTGSTMKFFSHVHLGFAVDTPRGLLVPVIRNAQALTLAGISREARRLAEACREGKAGTEELSGATFTVSNLGAFGIESFTPIINPPEVGILGVCATQLKPVEKDGEVVFRPFMGLSLTYDHQMVDGVPASRFLADLRNAMEKFELYLAG